jgi:hypothetical protein
MAEWPDQSRVPSLRDQKTHVVGLTACKCCVVIPQLSTIKRNPFMMMERIVQNYLSQL